MSAKLKRSPEAIRIRSLILRKKDAASVLLLATPALPDETPISRVNLPTRIRNVLTAEGIKTVGEARETSDETLLSFQDLGKGSVAELRQLLGLPSTEG